MASKRQPASKKAASELGTKPKQTRPRAARSAVAAPQKQHFTRSSVRRRQALLDELASIIQRAADVGFARPPVSPISSRPPYSPISTPPPPPSTSSTPLARPPISPLSPQSRPPVSPISPAPGVPSVPTASSPAQLPAQAELERLRSIIARQEQQLAEQEDLLVWKTEGIRRLKQELAASERPETWRQEQRAGGRIAVIWTDHLGRVHETLFLGDWARSAPGAPYAPRPPTPQSPRGSRP